MTVPIAIVLSSFEAGGTERQMTELIRRLDRRLFRVHVACIRRRGAWLRRVEAAAYEVVDFPMRSFMSPGAGQALVNFARWLRRRRIALVHACDLPTNVFALPGAALARVPVRIGSRRELAPPDKTRLHLTAQRLAYRTAHRIVANSAAAASHVVADGIASSRVVVIPNGVDLAAFPAAARFSSVDAGLARASDAAIVCTVANLRPEKGHDVLLRAAAMVLAQMPRVRFRIVGDGPLRSALVAQAAALGIAAAVEFLGHREDVPALLAESDLSVFPSRTEAFPNAVIEAMAAGLPVVSSAVGGVLELVEHDRNGILVPADHPDALAANVLALLGDRAKATRLGHAARATIQSRYSFDRMVSSFEHMYLSELATSSFGAARTRRELLHQSASRVTGLAHDGLSAVE